MARASVTLTSSRQKATHFPSISGLPVNLSQHSRQRESLCASHGLLNPPGDNNCFLNSAVQIFWHLDVFRRGFRTLNEHVCLDSACIFCGIKMLFQQFQESVGSPLAPNLLRQALASTFEDQQRFQLGCMDDAAECFENILLRIHYHVQGTSEIADCLDPRCIPHRKFSMDLEERSTCNDCQYSTESTAFSQMVHYVAVEGLLQKSAEMQQRGVKSLTGLFGKLIRKANENCGNQHVCRQCGSRNASLKRTLTNRPDIITIGFSWSTAKPKTQMVTEVLHAIDTNICLCHLYHSARETEWASSAVHHLVGMICFYGRHYVAFFYHSRYQTWMHFDDASVKVIGPDFSQVLTKCVKGHMQPLLLFYANPEFEPITGDLRYVASSDTSSCLSGKISLDMEVKRAARAVPKKPAPPRPPLRTVSCTSPLYQQQNRTTMPFQTGDRVTLPTALTEGATTTGASRLRMSGGQCSRQNSRASAASSSIASLESFDLSLDQFRSPYMYPPRCRNSIESSTREETDSGCPSGEHASLSSTSSSSAEIPTRKREAIPTRTFAAPAIDRNHCVQMLLRADDLISSGTLKEEKTDLTGAVKLFEQAAGLLQGLMGAEPLKTCPQLAQAVTTKQMDCLTRLHVLHDKITAYRSDTTGSGSRGNAAADLRNIAGTLNTLPRRSAMVMEKKSNPVKPINKYPTAYLSSSTINPRPVEQEATATTQAPDDSLKRMHKSRRKATAKNALGSREANRSMPDLSLSGEGKRAISHSTTLATFQAAATANSATALCARSAVRDTLLSELAQRFRRRSNAAAVGRAADDQPSETSSESENEEDDDFPLPPPPELLLPLNGENEFHPNSHYPCSLCGKQLVAHGDYCLGCQNYLMRFGGAV